MECIYSAKRGENSGREGTPFLPPTLSPHTGSFEPPRGVAQEWRKAVLETPDFAPPILAPPLLSHVWSMIATCWASDYPEVCRPTEAMGGWAGDMFVVFACLSGHPRSRLGEWASGKNAPGRAAFG